MMSAEKKLARDEAMKKNLLLMLLVSPLLWAKHPGNFPQAKKVATTIFQKHQTTLYCQCNYDSDKSVDLNSCHMDDAVNLPRSQRMEWEHMMPASKFGNNLACWQQNLCTDNKGKAYKGRRCCEKIDKNFQKMEGELFNLWPSDGLVNASRSNFTYAQLYPIVQSRSHDFHGCPVVVDVNNHLFEPSDASKGTVARAMLFMAEHYDIEIDSELYNLMTYWHRRFPPSDWEKSWDQAVAEIEGFHNPYIVA